MSRMEGSDRQLLNNIPTIHIIYCQSCVRDGNKLNIYYEYFTKYKNLLFITPTNLLK